MRSYRTPTAKEAERLEEARQMMRRGMEDEKGMMSLLMPTVAKSARDDIRAAKKMREAVPEAAREGEAYNQAGYKKGGCAKGYAKGGSVRGGGCEQRGKTKGRFV